MSHITLRRDSSFVRQSLQHKRTSGETHCRTEDDGNLVHRPHTQILKHRPNHMSIALHLRLSTPRDFRPLLTLPVTLNQFRGLYTFRSYRRKTNSEQQETLHSQWTKCESLRRNYLSSSSTNITGHLSHESIFSTSSWRQRCLGPRLDSAISEVHLRSPPLRSSAVRVHMRRRGSSA